MRNIVALVGAIAAAFAGTVAGNVVRPDMGSLVGQLSAPRLESIATARRAANNAEDVDATMLSEDVPDYVVGTDWLPPTFDEDAMQAEPTEVAPVAVVSAAAPAAAARPRALQALASGRSETLKKAPSAPAMVAATPPEPTPLF